MFLRNTHARKSSNKFGFLLAYSYLCRHEEDKRKRHWVVLGTGDADVADRIITRTDQLSHYIQHTADVVCTLGVVVLARTGDARLFAEFLPVGTADMVATALLAVLLVKPCIGLFIKCSYLDQRCGIDA